MEINARHRDYSQQYCNINFKAAKKADLKFLWLGFLISTADVLGLLPNQGTTIPHAMQCVANKTNKQKSKQKTRY